METPLTKDIRPGQEPPDLAAYERAGGYQAFRAAVRMEPQAVQQEVSQAKLPRGGAGFPTGVKWGFIPLGQASRRPRYLVVNADEMEPGTMKDRMLMEGNPHQLIEGLLIAAYAIRADVAYVFLRWAYKTSQRRLGRAIDEARAAGYIGRDILGTGWSLRVDLHVSAGRYMCGEEDGAMDSLEGKRAIPRSKPPHAPICGIWGHPTIINNVETVCCLPHILANGAGWFRSLSRTEEGGTKIYGVSGRVRNPGLWELPMGTPAREILMEHAGGMADGRQFRGALSGGASSRFLTEKDFDVPMDFAHLNAAGQRLGTGTLVVLDDRTCPVGMMLSLERFFARESCGWCTPCREGLPWVASTLQAIEDGQGKDDDLDVLDAHVRLLRMGHTFCALAPGAMLPLESALSLFRDDFRRHLQDHRCPWKP